MLSGRFSLYIVQTKMKLIMKLSQAKPSNFQLSEVMTLHFSVGLARSQDLFYNLKI